MYSSGKNAIEQAKEEQEQEASSVSSSETARLPNLYENAGWFSRCFFLWPYPVLKIGQVRPLESADLPEIPKTDFSIYNRDRLEALWKAEVEATTTYDNSNNNDNNNNSNKKASLHRVLLKDFFSSLWFVQPLQGAAAVARVVQSIAFGLLIESFETGEGGYRWAGILVFCALISLFEHHQVFFFTWHKGMQFRVASVAAIYAKSLRLSSTNQDVNSNSGKILNLASNDVERFLMTALFINFLFWAPLQSFAILGVGVWVMGAAFAAGFAVLTIVVLPLQLYLSNRFAFYRSKIAAITDQRVSLVSQAVYGTRVMKMSGWEHQFLDRIARIREQEITQIGKANRLKAYNEALFFCTNVVISVIIFLVHVAMGENLTPRNVFTVMSLVNIIQLELTKHVSLAVMATSECRVSVTRIQKFLEFTELPSASSSEAEKVQYNPADDRALTFNDATCYWNGVKTPDAKVNTSLLVALSDITLECKTASLTCVIGSVGAGKSALLQAMVGELPISSGTFVRNYRSIAYASQDSFVMDGTIRDNITLGLPFDATFYEQVVNATGLAVDFEQFRTGDATIVGDRGVQCSGGQRARIGLARALYRDADVLICDDPLSAVDARVGRLIFYEALMGLAVKRGKCVVLATHQHQYVSDARCLLMAQGKIQCIGSYDECVKASGGKISAPAPSTSVDDSDSKSTQIEDVSDEKKDSELHEQDKIGLADGKESNVQGLVQRQTFSEYAKAMGGIWIAVVGLILFTVTQASVLVTIGILGKWAERSPEEQDSWDILCLVSGLTLLVMSLSIIRALVSFRLTVQASQRLHDRMTKAVLRAKVEFFDTNPLGRVLNRFSADIGSNDDLLPHTLYDFLMIAFFCLGSLVTAMVALPFTLIAAPPIIWYFLSVRKTFVTSSRELKRLEGLARSPIFSMLSESLSGISTIRANNAVEYFSNKFAEVHNAHSRAFFSFLAASRWVGFRLDALVFLILALASFLSILFTQRGWFEIDPAILGLAISMLLQLAGVFQWMIRQSAEVVNQMVSVERVLGFCHLAPEAPLNLENDDKLKNWPENGTMTVSNLSVRYRSSLPLSLKNVSFTIPSGAHVGVVGRTGSGKSTLIQALFRLLEPEQGSIELAGKDIQSIGLHTLRTRISVIPQHPVLFAGCTIRENLDPFDRHTDQEIQNVLENVHMWHVVQDLADRWNTLVAEGGSNFSVGQRQLFCLARAILHRNKILILDEPTANVDRRTEELLQEALHKSFENATILSVAHRLDTVIESDFILVLGQGCVLEFGRPSELLANDDGHFSRMVRDTGSSMSQSLRAKAIQKMTGEAK